MKFEKFVKSLASTGTIYERENGERWLASPTCFMLIPPTIKSVTAEKVTEMPPFIENIISKVGGTDPATLYKAIMPIANGGIKDCLRQFINAAGYVKCTINNDNWTLIEKSDFTEILVHYNMEHDTYSAKALLVKQYPVTPEDDDLLVGIIFPVAVEEGRD